MDSGPGDEMLLLAVAERDMGAFRTLYERHAWWLAIRLARRCNDRDLVADAIGDTFVAVWQKPRGFRGDDDIAIADLLRAAHPGRGVHPPPPGEATP
jgi:class 3 adenylate cyclase